MLQFLYLGYKGFLTSIVPLLLCVCEEELISESNSFIVGSGKKKISKITNFSYFYLLRIK